MTELEAQNVIDGIFENLNGIRVLHENEDFVGDDEEWVRVSVQYGKGQQVSMGDNPLYRYFGVCFVQIFVKPNIGCGRALEIADMITPLLRSKQIGGITFRVPTVNKVGVDRGWYQVNVLTALYRED